MERRRVGPETLVHAGRDAGTGRQRASPEPRAFLAPSLPSPPPTTLFAETFQNGFIFKDFMRVGLSSSARATGLHLKHFRGCMVVLGSAYSLPRPRALCIVFLLLTPDLPVFPECLPAMTSVPVGDCPRAASRRQCLCRCLFTIPGTPFHLNKPSPRVSLSDPRPGRL